MTCGQITAATSSTATRLSCRFRESKRYGIETLQRPENPRFLADKDTGFPNLFLPPGKLPNAMLTNKKRKHYENTAFVAKASPFLLVSPLVRRPSWSFLVSLVDCCSARTLDRPAFALRKSARTWLGDTNCLFS